MIKPGHGFDLSQANVRLYRGGTSEVVLSQDGSHPAVDGFVVGAPRMERSPPHGGELHPDGDELLCVLSGSVAVVLEEEDGERRVELTAGQAIIVPRGIWHRVVVLQPCQLIHMTPGPGAEYRPLPRSKAHGGI